MLRCAVLLGEMVDDIFGSGNSRYTGRYHEEAVKNRNDAEHGDGDSGDGLGYCRQQNGTVAPAEPLPGPLVVAEVQGRDAAAQLRYACSARIMPVPTSTINVVR